MSYNKGLRVYLKQRWGGYQETRMIAVSVNSTKVNKIQFLRKDRYLHLSGSKITSHCLRVNLYADCEKKKKKTFLERGEKKKTGQQKGKSQC